MMKSGYKKVKRMTVTGRTIHWINAFSILAAVITGLYIAHPYYQTFIADPAVDKYVMAWNRWVHFICAIILDVTSIVIAYLYFFSRFEKPYKKLIPTGKNIKEFVEVLLNLLTLNRRKNFDSSHNDSFNIVYFTIMHLLLAWMLLTGLQLYVHGLESGLSSIGNWWPAMLHLVTDWTIPVTGGTLMDVRISHHYTMWWIVAWVMFHIYYQVWRTIYWQEGDMAIVFGGSKFKKEE
ncbi:Ni/Fe-hydrogenase, b-type cytochrome subunit [Hydrogenimonas cancrithermarum]|uniref:Ni/Fe-hydrogenase, b-type cytochrome subunit n=2 Tax=Hydrogenimonas cancrithermarum TaxID=2993563 RepID=A0ABN6WUF9_9BACT|nr:Ni/Fe-hydrogenase, b-type cytochrome subunit [Hydrogenimonas cancrithermarum]